MEKISWGIIGCGDVTELKSGPAFNKVGQSQLYAVMRREITKAEDYARRHKVPKFYGEATRLINDPKVNAIYIATPPDSHETYAIQAIHADKPVYVEKPMTIDYASALRLQEAVAHSRAKLCVAHYRNAQPFFLSIKQLIAERRIGTVKKVDLVFHRPVFTGDDLLIPQKAWRVDPYISGGGLFHDLAPHQLATLLMIFGEVKDVKGSSMSTSGQYIADDHVEAEIHFENGVVFKGAWNFNSSDDLDECVITGDDGMIRFPFFGEQEWQLSVGGDIQARAFDPPQHVQQPMIEKVVRYFLGQAENPCPVSEGVEVMRLIETITKH